MTACITSRSMRNAYAESRVTDSSVLLALFQYGEGELTEQAVFFVNCKNLSKVKVEN